jgi:hypothetical protein
MKRVLISAATLFFAIMPIAVHAAPVSTASITAPKQAVCEKVIVVLEDGSAVEGMLCYMVGGRT